MILLTMKYLLRNLEIELDPPTFPSFNDNGIIYCYIKCIREEHNNPAIFINSPPPLLDLHFITDNAEQWFFFFFKFPFWHCLFVAILTRLPWTKSQPRVCGRWACQGKLSGVADCQGSEFLWRKSTSAFKNWGSSGFTGTAPKSRLFDP